MAGAWGFVWLMLEKKADLQSKSSICALLGRADGDGDGDGAGVDAVLFYPWQRHLPCSH
jgi:hypothetical protein